MAYILSLLSTTEMQNQNQSQRNSIAIEYLPFKRTYVTSLHVYRIQTKKLSIFLVNNVKVRENFKKKKTERKLNT